WDTEVYYDSTTGVSAYYSKNTSALSAQLESDEDGPSEADKSEIDPLIRESTDTLLMGDEEIKLNSHEDIDDLVLIPRVFKKPLDSRDPISKTFDMTITNPLFDFDSEFTLNSDNPIFDIQNQESDESETETIIKEVQIHSSQSTAQIPPSFGLVFLGNFSKVHSLDLFYSGDENEVNDPGIIVTEVDLKFWKKFHRRLNRLAL
ncbi:hypothetical protein Tco_0522233, partial [Tanacetum coccineum]